MTKKHFIKLAALMANVRPEESDRARFADWVEFRAELMLLLKEFNPRFDKAKFIEATNA